MSQVTDTVNVNVVAWPAARKYLADLAAREFRLAAVSATEFERGQHAGRGKMCEDLQNLPEALSMLAEEDKREEGTKR